MSDMTSSIREYMQTSIKKVDVDEVNNEASMVLNLGEDHKLVA